MELSKDLVGRLVAIQFARPLMMFEYGEHVIPKQGPERLLGRPLIIYGPGGKDDPEGGRAAVTDFVMGATIEEVGKDWVRFSLLDIRRDDDKVANRTEHTDRTEHTVPSLLIMQVVEMVGFEVETPARMTKTRPQSKILL